MSISVRYADTFRNYLSFIKDEDTKKDISHHMQYIEFLYKIGRIHKPKLTTRSLLIKTIIVEYFTIIEAMIDDMLCQLNVKVCEGKFIPLDIHKYMNAECLFDLAKKYEIVDSNIYGKICRLKKWRNKIHIKRHDKKQKYECEQYSPDDLKEFNKIYKDFLSFLFKKYKAKMDFPWPWEANE